MGLVRFDNNITMIASSTVPSVPPHRAKTVYFGYNVVVVALGDHDCEGWVYPDPMDIFMSRFLTT